MPRHKERSAALQPGNKYDVPVHLLAAGDGACTSYDSLIVLDAKPTTRSSDHNQLAGLLDRLSVLMGVACLASSLCARVVPAGPSQMLDTIFEPNEHPLDSSWTWDRYVGIHTQDGLPLLLDSEPSAERVEIARNARMDVEHRQALELANAGKPFLWRLAWHNNEPENGHIQKWPVQSGLNFDLNRSLSLSTGGFGPRSPVASYGAGATKDLVDAFIAAHNVTSHHTLHVRRGDSLAECESSIPTVVRYTSCMLENEGSLNGTSDLILLTDEKDPEYLSGVLAALTDLFEGRRRVLHADAELEKLYREGNDVVDNFALFNAALMLQETAVGALEIRNKLHGTVGINNNRNASACAACERLAEGAPRAPPHRMARRSEWGCSGAY